jgi:myo-inositol-1(or 4)-monophosphatase
MPADETTFWLVDPIDGTVNFANGVPYFAISAGLWEGGGFRVGAVSLPAFKELFFTHGDEAAFLNGRRLKVRPARIDEALVGVSFPGRATAEKQDPYGMFGRVNEATRGCLRLGSAAALVCLVACGRLQGAYGFGAKIWDVGGALAIALRAGAEVRFRRHPGGPLIDYVVAAPGAGGPLRQILGEGPEWEVE